MKLTPLKGCASVLSYNVYSLLQDKNVIILCDFDTSVKQVNSKNTIVLYGNRQKFIRIAQEHHRTLNFPDF